MSTLVCVPIMVRDVESALSEAGAAKSADADLVEFRIDEFFSGSGEEGEAAAILKIVAESVLPCIVTCRAGAEGGHYDGDDMARIALYERLGTATGTGESPPRYIDVELATYVHSANLKQKVNLAVDHPAQGRDLRTSLILSTHDFQGRPSDLTRRVAAMRAEPAVKVYKIAYRARSARDNLELFDLLHESDRPMIALGMGEFGLMSRVLAPKFGGFLTFASLNPTAVTAPGQPTVQELLGRYRFRSIKPSTGVYGIVGWPVGHSLSPLIHNAGFEAAGHDGVYVPMPVPAGEGPGAPGGFENFKATLLEFIGHPRLSFGGCSVTIPHKENLVRLAREQGWELDELAALCGAANTLVVERDAEGLAGKIRVLNTDGPALLGALGGREALRGKNVAVVGAGGTGRTAVFALAGAGAKVVVYNRTGERAGALALDASHAGLRVSAGDWGRLDADSSDVFVNCTSVGLAGTPAAALESAIPVRAIAGRGGGEKTAMDCLYTPPLTPFLKEARAAGWRTIDGVEMFVGQAAGQFEAWTGRDAPRGLFEKLVRGALGGPDGG